MFCPSTSVKKSELYKKHVEALGEPLTYLVYHKNDGNLLNEGKTAEIYKQIFDKVQDEVLAIKLTSKVFGSNVTLSKVKKGVDFVFEQNPELSEIGSQQQYSAYLDTIFPDSMIDTIEHHATKADFKNSGFKKGFGQSSDAFWFTDIKSQEDWGPNKIFVKVNVKNLYDVDFYEQGEYLPDANPYMYIKKARIEKLQKEGYDAVIAETYLGVFEPDQIHILGSKQDIQGFEQFINKEKQAAKPSRPSRLKRQSVKSTPKQIEVRPKEDQDLIDEASLDLNNMMLGSFVLLDNIQMEQDIVNSLTNTTLNILDELAASGQKRSLTKAYEMLLEDLQQEYEFFSYFGDNTPSEEDIESGAYSTSEENKIIANNLKLVLDNFNETKEGDKVKYVGFGFRITHEIGNMKFKATEEVENDTEELDKTYYADSWFLKQDPEKSLSAEVKRMLTFIPKKDSKGNTESNILGYETFERYDKVFNYLQAELVNVPATEMFNTLEKLAKENTIAEDVLDKLKELKVSDMAAYNKFHVVFRKQEALFKMLRSYPRDKDGRISYSVFDANRSGALSMVVDAWHESFKTKGLDTGLFTVDKETGQLNVNVSKGKELKKEFDELVVSKDNYDVKVKALSELFNKIGLDITIEQIKKINDERQSKAKYVKYKKYFEPANTFNEWLQNDISYIFNTLSGSLREDSIEEPWQNNNPFYTQSKRITGLAAYYAAANPNITSASFRNSNGDTVYGFVMPSHLSNRMQKIKDDLDYVAQLQQVPFIQNSTWLTEDVEHSYFDASKNARSRQDAKSYNEQSPVEKEYTKLGLFQKAGKKAVFIGNTPSDKSTFPLFETERHNTQLGIDVFDNGVINGDAIDITSESFNRIYNLVVQSEVNRINAVITAYNTLPQEKLIPGYHYMKTKDGKTIPGGGNYFFFVPELNKVSSQYRDAEGKLTLGDEGNITLKQELAKFLTKLAKDKVQSWNSKGIVNFEEGKHSFDKSYAKKKLDEMNRDGKAQNLINYTAMDFVVNYMMSYANQFMVVTGDPALFTKPTYKFTDYEALIGNVSDNIFKRTAKDIAPGLEGLFDTQNYNVVFLNEPVDGSVMADYKERLDNLTGTYEKADIADAQEWTTLKEHINVMYAYGKLDADQRTKLIDKIQKRKDAPAEEKSKYNLTWDEIRDVLQPMKPVQVYSEIDKELRTDVQYYIKTSSFPLIPQLTEGFEIDKLREAMEEHNVDRAVVPSGVKTGFRNSINVFTGNNVSIGEDFVTNITSLSREGFRIQQEVPHDYTKNKILEGSQLRKMKFANLTIDLNFDLYGTNYKGYELKELDDQIHSRVYDLKFNALLKKLGVTDGVTITDVTKLRSLLVESAKDLGYGYNDQMLLNTITLESGRVIFDVPLFFHNNADKIESMLNSIIKNKVLKNKMSGLSFVQGSSAGFTSNVAGEEFLQEIMKTTKARIAFTKHYKGDKLDYREYEENGKKVIYGEVFAPFMFINTKADGTKEPLRLEDYTDEQGFIKEDKLADNLLNLLGYRIPTQGHNSMIKLKIVGFLPQEAGDLIIVPGAITKQMGSDFDVDKLFTHFYNYKVSKGSISKIQPNLEKGAENLTEGELHNLSLDITYSILSNETVQNKYQFQSVDNPALAIDKEKIKSMKPGKKVEVNRTKPQNSSILYDEYQTHMVDVNAAGKVGIGSFSTASANHILFQYAGVAIVSPTDSKGRVMKDKEVSVMFKDDAGNIYTDLRSGDDYDNNRVKPAIDYVEITPQGEKKIRSYYGYSPNQGAWRLDKVWTFENPITKQRKSISEVISYYQSASVDNAKDQHLFDLHLNNETFRVTSLIARAGFDEMFIDRFINQPIIVEYVKRLKDTSNFTELEFDPNKVEKIQNQLFSEQGVKPSTLKVNAVSLSEMEDAIKDDGKNKVFQAQILYNFIKYADVAKEVARVQNAINVDTAFLGKSLYSSIVKKDMLSKNNFYLGNVSNLVDGTTQGAAIEYGLEGSLNLFSGNNLYPTQSTVISSIFDSISTELDSDISEDDAYKIMNDVRASLFALAHENVFKSDINETRRELLFGTEKKQSLAKRVFAVQSTTDNIFLRSLTINQSYTKEDPDVIEFGASKDIRKELDFAMFLGWNELLHSSDPNLKELGEDLVKYSFLTGNQRTARDFGRFLPYDYIITSGLNKFYRNIDFNTPNDITEKVLANFVTQWFQHNPFRAKQVERVMFDNATDFEGKKSSKNDIPDIITLKNQEQEGMADFYTDRNDNFKSPEFITLLDEKRTPYLYQDRNGVYSRIPVLGQGQLIKEYNVNEFANQSIFRPHVKDIRYNMVAIHKEESIQREPGNKVFAAYEFEKGYEAVLNNIINNSGNELNVAVAKFYKDNIDTIKDIYRLEEFDPTKHYNDIGDANPRGRTRPGEFIAINTSNNETPAKFEETFLHELTHAFLVEKLESTKSKELQDIMDSLDKHKDKLSDVKWLKQIGVERLDENGWVYKDYTFSKQGEFASFLMSNSDFQKILDNIESEQDKSLLQRIKEIIFKILGINVKDTKLAEGLSVVIGIIEDNKTSEPVTNNVISQEVRNEITNKLDSAIKESARKHLPKEKVKARIATQYIGDGAKDSSTDRYRKLYEQYNIANTGKYSSNDVIWVSSNGRRSNRVNPVSNGKLQGVYTNIDLAINAGATIVMDTEAHIENTKYYNIGEVALAEYMAAYGYERQGNSGVWKPINKVQPGVEISSNTKGIGGALTNPTELARRKGNIQKSYPIEYAGKTYRDVEAAYQAKKAPYLKNKTTDKLMLNLLEIKFRTYPFLVDEITKRGGKEWILASTHQPTSKNSYWETGGQNGFIVALAQAYENVIKTPKSGQLSLFDTQDLIDGYKFPTNKPKNRFIKSALTDATIKESYVDEIKPFTNRRTVTNSYFRYARDKKPYYPYSTGDIKTDIALVHKINSLHEGERVVYYKGSEGVIRFTTKSEQATPMSELLDREETLRGLEAEKDLAKLDELNKVIKNWHDDYDHIDYENPSNADKLIIAKQKVIKYLQQRLTEKGVDRADIKARISTLEAQVKQLEEDQTDKNVEDIIKLTLKSVNNELTNTQAQLNSSPSEDTLFSILKRLGEIDIYLEGIRNVDELLFSSSDELKKQYRLLGADVNDARKDYLEQTRDALLQIARKVSYESFQNVDKDVLFGSAEDISLVTREVLSAANAKNGVSKLVHDLIKRAEYDIRQKQREISTTIDTKVKELEKHTGKKGKDLMDLFLQRYENGKYTGNTVGRYKQEFFDERNAIYEKFRLGTIDAKGLRDWYKANQHTITREELESGVSDVFSEEEMLRQKELLERYEQDLEAYKEQIESSFTDSEGVVDNAGMMNAVEEWINIHSPYIYIDSVNGATKYNKFRQGKNYIIPAKPNKKWEDKAFDKFMKNDKVVDEVLYDFYKFMKETFSENNKLLPYVNRLPGNYLPEIRKSFLERTSDSGVLKGLMSLGEEFRNTITDEVQGIIDYDIELGNRKFKAIPVRMMQNMLEADEKSLDIFRILKLHSAMANSYAYKARVEPLLNASQQVLEEMAEVQMRETTKGKQPVKDQWNQKKLRKAGLVNTRKQLEHTIGAFLYGDYRDIEGRIGKAKLSKKDKEKLANLQEQLDKGEITQEQFDTKSNLVGRQVTVTGITDVLNKYTYLNALGFPNFITPSVNLTFGIASNFIYASGDRIIDLKNMRKSINMFTKAILGKYSGVDKAHFNKMWAWMEELGILDDFNESLYGTTKTLADKALFLQNNTERMNRGVMMLAHLLSVNVKDKNGNNVPLYYAYNEVNGKLVWNVDKMGEQVETTRQDKITRENEGVNLYTLTRLIERVNQNVHGDYESSLRVKRTVAGRVLGMFKTWMPMSIMYRFGSEYYDEELQRDVKGRYTVLWSAKDLEGNAIKTTDFLKLLARASFKKNGLADLSETDREAVRRNLKELQFIAQFTIAVLALASIETDDDEEKFALNLLINFLTKAQADLSFFTDPSAMAQVVNNVAPVYTTVRNLFSITNVAWETISGSPNYEAGPLKDKNRAVVWSLKNLPLTNPAMRIWNYGDRVVSYF